jgi:hypothetical protein
MAQKMDRIASMSSSIGSERYKEKAAPRNTVYNETVRADNKRMDRGQATKPLPRGKAGDKIWRKKGRKSGR